jgi:hypothetical protein
MHDLIKGLAVLTQVIWPLFLTAGEYEKEAPVLPQKSWTELVEQLGPYTLSARELHVTDCPQEITDEKKVAGSYQHIMFNDYMWDVYELADGNGCVELLQPDIGLLTSYEARVLLSASRNVGFGESGFNHEIESIALYQESLMSECDEEDDFIDDFSNYKDTMTLDADAATARFIPYTEEMREMIDSHSIDSHFTSESSKSKLAAQYKNSEDIAGTAHLGCLKKTIKKVPQKKVELKGSN